MKINYIKRNVGKIWLLIAIIFIIAFIGKFYEDRILEEKKQIEKIKNEKIAILKQKEILENSEILKLDKYKTKIYLEEKESRGNWKKWRKKTKTLEKKIECIKQNYKNLSEGLNIGDCEKSKKSNQTQEEINDFGYVRKMSWNDFKEIRRQYGKGISDEELGEMYEDYEKEF